MYFVEQAAAPPEGEGQQHPIQAMVPQPDAPLQGSAPEVPTLDMPAGNSQGASLLLDASTLHGMLQQTPLESHEVLEPEQQVSTNMPASLPSKAGRRGLATRRRKQSRPTSAAAAAAAAPAPAACLVVPTATGEAQVKSGLEHQPMAPPAGPQALPTQPAAGASLPSVAPVETADIGKLCHKSSSLASVSSRSLKAEILAKLESVLSSGLLPATATAVSSGGSTGTGQAVATCEGVNPSAGEMRSEMKGRLRALLQGGGLQELAALLSSEDSEVGSDFSDESGSPSGNGTSGDGSGDGVTHNNEQASSYVEQDQVVGQSKVHSRSWTPRSLQSVMRNEPVIRNVLSNNMC